MCIYRHNSADKFTWTMVSEPIDQELISKLMAISQDT